MKNLIPGVLTIILLTGIYSSKINAAIIIENILGQGYSPTAINNNGDVVGVNGSGQAFKYNATSNSQSNLTGLGGTSSEAKDINDNGEAVGWAENAQGKKTAVKWSNDGTATNLQPNVPFNTVAESINNNGLTVGWANSGNLFASYLWDLGQPGGIAIFGSTNQKALGVNANGEIVGVTVNGFGNPIDGYYFDGIGGYGDYTTLIDSFFAFGGININGVAAGEFEESIATWNNNDAITPFGQLDPLNDPYATALGINGFNDFCGYSGDKGFLYDWSSQSLFNINDILDTSTPFSSIKSLTDINDKGEFIGIGIGKDDGLEYGFSGKLTTEVVPEPRSIDIWTCGVSALVRYIWRKATDDGTDDAVKD